MSGDEQFGVDGWTNKPVTNVLEAGRYNLIPEDFEFHNAPSGNKCILATFKADGVRLKKYFILKDLNDKPHKMSYQWRQYIYACGIRNPGKNFSLSKEKLLTLRCKADIVKVPDDKFAEDGVEVFKNEIRYFSPIEQGEAPIKDVPPEEESGQALTEQTVKEEPEKKTDEQKSQKKEEKKPEKKKPESEDTGDDI